MLAHEQWMAKAHEDFNAARILRRNKAFSVATYHCQQAAEKALKCYLVFKKQELMKSHDLVKLCALCKKFDHDFEKLAYACEMLSPFATKFRYPSEFDIPDLSEIKEVTRQTKKILMFTEKKISQAAVGQMEIR
jgi:HEPN domain-containing protein